MTNIDKKIEPLMSISEAIHILEVRIEHNQAKARKVTRLIAIYVWFSQLLIVFLLLWKVLL